MSELKSEELGKQFTNCELKNMNLVSEVYATLNGLVAKDLEKYFLDDASLHSLNETSPPIEGKEAICEFFEKFFSDAKSIHFELIGNPHAMGDIVTIKHIDHFELDGTKHNIEYVSVIVINELRIKKWLGYIQ